MFFVAWLPSFHNALAICLLMCTDSASAAHDTRRCQFPQALWRPRARHQHCRWQLARRTSCCWLQLETAVALTSVIVQMNDRRCCLSACTMQSVLPRQCYSDPCVPCPKDPLIWRIPSVFCSNFDLPISILSWWWNEKLIAHPMWKNTRNFIQNHDIVLQSRINETVSSMALKSSEVQDS